MYTGAGMSRSIRSGFWAGVVAGGIAVTAISLGLFTSGIPAVALALWDRMLRLVPMQLFSFFIVRLKFAAKPSAFWGMLLALVVLWGVLGALLARRRPVARMVLAWLVSAGAPAAPTLPPATALPCLWPRPSPATRRCSPSSTPPCYWCCSAPVVLLDQAMRGRRRPREASRAG